MTANHFEAALYLYNVQAETSKKPTAVNTAPRHQVRKNLSMA
jgi:hypothetical protein